MRPTDRSYLKSHEWCKIERDVATIGITDHAVSHLSDLVFLDLPQKGSSVTIGESFGEIESVKAVSDLYSPVDGEVIEINTPLINDPAPVSKDPYGKGWMVKIKVEPGSTLDKLMTLEQYQKQIASGG
jgi:glycine cleavage system H protein